MDLGTIKRRLEKGHHYAHPDLVQPDIALVFANAMQYNPAGSDVHVMASTLQELCTSKWAAMVAPRLVEVSGTGHPSQPSADWDWRSTGERNVAMSNHLATRPRRTLCTSAEARAGLVAKSQLFECFIGPCSCSYTRHVRKGRWLDEETLAK
jgi:hypothetical protein